MAPEHEIPGKRTLATVVDRLARECPTRLVCKIPNSHQVADGYSVFDIKALSKAIDSTAWLIKESLGTPDKDEILLYLGDNDVRYLILTVACQKAGYKPFLPSTQNALDVQYSLVEQTGCSGILFSDTWKDQAKAMQDAGGVPALLHVPSLDEMIANFSRSFPYDTAYEAIEDESAIIIHSSGTTGIPKPIHLTHGFLGTMDKQAQVPVPEGRLSAVPNRLGQDDLLISTAPFFHLMGIFAEVMSVFNGTPFTYPPPTNTLTVETLVQVIKMENPTVAVITPALVEATGRSLSTLQTLSTLRMVCIGGAPLAPDIGEALNKRTNLVTVLGATELGLVLSLVPENKADWEYFEWNPNYHARMDQCIYDSNLYELVIPRGKTRDIHGIFHTFPEIDGYCTKDLFSPHSTRPNLWKYEGRLDDTITLTNGQKIYPIPMEKIIESHSLVARAVVIGNRRSHAALLVEPSLNSDFVITDESSVSEFVHAIWPAVEKANELAPSGGLIGIMRIGLASSDKPFHTTLKGSVQRRRVLKDYEEEIEKIYQHDEQWYNLFRNG